MFVQLVRSRAVGPCCCGGRLGCGGSRGPNSITDCTARASRYGMFGKSERKRIRSPICGADSARTSLSRSMPTAASKRPSTPPRLFATLRSRTAAGDRVALAQRLVRRGRYERRGSGLFCRCKTMLINDGLGLTNFSTIGIVPSGVGQFDGSTGTRQCNQVTQVCTFPVAADILGVVRLRSGVGRQTCVEVGRSTICGADMACEEIGYARRNSTAYSKGKRLNMIRPNPTTCSAASALVTICGSTTPNVRPWRLSRPPPAAMMFFNQSRSGP